MRLWLEAVGSGSWGWYVFWCKLGSSRLERVELVGNEGEGIQAGFYAGDSGRCQDLGRFVMEEVSMSEYLDQDAHVSRTTPLMA
jgi:hypothetical protein